MTHSVSFVRRPANYLSAISPLSPPQTSTISVTDVPTAMWNPENLRALLTIVGMLDSAAIDVLQSLSSDISDFEDAVMVETAKRASVDCIVTRNQKDYAKSPVPVFGPGEFLEYLMSSGEEPLE